MENLLLDSPKCLACGKELLDGEVETCLQCSREACLKYWVDGCSNCNDDTCGIREA